MVIEGDFEGQSIPLRMGIFEELGTKAHVPFHQLEFLFVQRTFLLKKGVGNAHFADVVQHGGGAKHIFVRGNFLTRNVSPFGPPLVEFDRIRADPLDVGLGLLRVANLSHGQHLLDHVAEQECPLDGHTCVEREQPDEVLLIVGERNDLTVLILGVDELQDSLKLAFTGHKGHDQHRGGSILADLVELGVEAVGRVFGEFVHVVDHERAAVHGNETRQ